MLYAASERCLCQLRLPPRLGRQMVDNYSRLVVKCAELRYYDFSKKIQANSKFQVQE